MNGNSVDVSSVIIVLRLRNLPLIVGFIAIGFVLFGLTFIALYAVLAD